MQVSPSSWRFHSLFFCLLLLAGCGQAKEETGPSTGHTQSPAEPDQSDPEQDPGELPPPMEGPGPSWCPANSDHVGIPALREQGTAEGGNAMGVHGCTSSRYAHYEHPGAQGTSPQLHVIGIYEPAGSSSGNVEVRVKRRGASVLVLSAYSETTWNVVVEPNALVERILVSGYEPQHVIAPAGIPMEIHSYTQDGTYLGGFGYEWPSYRTTQLVGDAEEKTGYELTSFRGCNASTSFEIDEPGELRPPHSVSDRSEPTLPAGCEALGKESVYCMTLNQGVPAIIGLDSGRVCTSQVPSTYGGFYDSSSLAWQGDYVYACVHERGLARLSLLDGSVDIAPIACQAVSTHREGLLVMLDHDGKTASHLGELVHFDDFAAAARSKASCIFNHRPYASRMAVHGDRGYFAWHSTNEISTGVLGASTDLQSVSLKGYDDWIMGMDVTDDGRLLLLGGPWYAPGVYLFQAETGASLGTLPLSDPTWGGLACRSRK